MLQKLAKKKIGKKVVSLLMVAIMVSSFTAPAVAAASWSYVGYTCSSTRNCGLFNAYFQKWLKYKSGNNYKTEHAGFGNCC